MALDRRHGRPTSWSLLLTQAVSALWHGLYPGQWFFFLNTALFFQAGKVLFRYARGTDKSVIKIACGILGRVLPQLLIIQVYYYDRSEVGGGLDL